MGQKFSNAARVELATTINNTDTTINIVGGGSLFPVANTDNTAVGTALDWFKLVIQDKDNFEIVYVRTHAAASDTFTNVLRGQEGTTAVGFVAGAVVGLRPTASDAQATVDGLASKAPISSPTFTGTVGGITKAMVGLSNVDNTADSAKPISTAQQTALNAKAPLASPTFTGTVGGITKTMVGLSNVNNTSDADKPVSTAQAAALTGKQATLVSGTNIKTINDQSILGSGNINVAASVDEVRKPNNLSPANGATALSARPVLSASPYFSLYGIPMAASQWQVSTVANFATTVLSTGDVAGTATTYTLAAGVVDVNTTYYWRVRYKDSEGQYSQWSVPFSFVTLAIFNSFIPTPSATPASFGAAFEGGFYSGLIWNELVQSSTSKALATGLQTFAVPDMVATPLVYEGQMLEVRSRANPTNNFKGTVVSAAGGSLALNVTSISGSGTFADWSVMARYRVITSPKSSGDNAGIAIKAPGGDLPMLSQTPSEGLASTLAMYAADSSAVYPAAHWAKGLSIGGYSDWYVPSRDELELQWRNLKPAASSTENMAGQRGSSSYNYVNRGAFPDVAVIGNNQNSFPQGSNYTSSIPGQTASPLFIAGGSEAFTFAASAVYSSSTSYASNLGWAMQTSGAPGGQTAGSITSAYHVRAVRRSII